MKKLKRLFAARQAMLLKVQNITATQAKPKRWCRNRLAVNVNFTGSVLWKKLAMAINLIIPPKTDALPPVARSRQLKFLQIAIKFAAALREPTAGWNEKPAWADYGSEVDLQFITRFISRLQAGTLCGHRSPAHNGSPVPAVPRILPETLHLLLHHFKIFITCLRLSSKTRILIVPLIRFAPSGLTLSRSCWIYALAINWQALREIVLALCFLRGYNLRRFVIVFNDPAMVH